MRIIYALPFLIVSPALACEGMPFYIIDQNQDKQILAAEFENAFSDSGRMPAFAKIDINNDKKIDEPELKTFYTEIENSNKSKGILTDGACI